MNERTGNDDLGRRMNDSLREGNKPSWKEENRCRTEDCATSECVLNKPGSLLVTKGVIRKRWREYFKEMIRDDSMRLGY